MNVPRRLVTDRVFGVFNSIQLPAAIAAENGSWKMSTKDVDIWTNVQPYDQPYLGLICPENTGGDPQAFGLTKWKLMYYGMIYIRRDAIPLTPGNYVQDIIDDVLDSLDNAFAAPRKGEQNTLGGIVQDCMIDGTIQVDPGTLDQQIAIVVPVSILTGI